MLNAIGLLAGVGSLLREAEDAGFNIVGNMETRSQYFTGRKLSWDLNFPKVPLIREPLAHRLPDDIDLAIGHPPCGSQSALGYSGQSADLSDDVRASRQAKRMARKGLVELYVSQVKLIKPRMFVLDNLPKMLDTVAPVEWWETMLPQYRMTFIIMKNWDYGTPQLRERLWIVGSRKPLPRFEFKAPKRRLPGPETAMEAFEGLNWEPWLDEEELGHVHVLPSEMLTGDYRTTIDGLNVTRAAQLGLGFLSIPPDRAWPYKTRTGRIAVKIGRQRLNYAKRSRTITGLPSIHHPMTGWPLTPRERARLMNWPDDFHLGNGQTVYDRYALMRLTLFTGKAVPSGFPRYLMPQLVKHLNK